MPQAGIVGSSMISPRWKMLTVTAKSESAENLVDAPSREWSVGCQKM